MLYKTFNDWVYTDSVTAFQDTGDIYLPIVVDTEYTDGLNRCDSQITITAQCKGVNDKDGLIYTHPDMIERRSDDHRLPDIELRHELFDDFVAVNYLRDRGYDATIRHINRAYNHSRTFEGMPKIYIDIYGMFLVVDFLRIVRGKYQKDLIDLCAYPTRERGITMERRLRFYTWYGSRLKNWVQLPWIITIEGQDYQVKLGAYDIGGLHGGVGLDAIAHNVGVTTEKRLIDPSDKNNMLEVYMNRREVYDRYALGDLCVYDILMSYIKLLEKIYELMNVNKFFDKKKSVRLTIGTCTNQLIMSKLLSTDIGKDLFTNLSKNTNANYLKRDKSTTKAYLLKVDGGRCFNNRPLDTSYKSENDIPKLYDIDIKGAYSTSQKSLFYPIGNPMVIDYPLETKVSGKCNYLTLRQFLKKYKRSLVDGGWFARVSLKSGYTLKYEQDVFMSWYPAKNEIHLTETEKIDGEVIAGNFDSSWSKIFSNEIHLATLNSDLLEWIEKIASEKQRKELLDNLEVIAAMIYPKEKEVTSIEELKEKFREHKGKNTTEIDVEKGRKEVITEDFHYWYRYDYGNEYIKALQDERGKYPKGNPLNTLFKLFGNTSYGDIVSPWFECGNVVLGNNITARVRVVMWCIEKSFYGYQSITDGCVINLDEIPFIRKKNRRLNGYNTVGGYRKKLSERDWSIDSLDAYDWRSHGLLETLKGVLIEHFGKLSCVEIFDIEIKRIAQEAVFHGSGNYGLIKVIEMESIKQRKERIEDYFPDQDIRNTIDDENVIDMDSDVTYIPPYNWVYDDDVFKMRSYSRKELTAFDWENYDKETFNREDYYLSEELENNTIDYAEKFLKELIKDDNHLNRQNPLITKKILKPKEFKNRIESLKHLRVIPGETLEGVRLPLEISLNQFLYQTSKQYNKTVGDSIRLKKLWGQGFEIYFLNEDNTLRYRDSIKEIDKWIQTGKLNLLRQLENGLEGGLNPKKVYHPMKSEKDRLEYEIESEYLRD